MSNQLNYQQLIDTAYHTIGSSGGTELIQKSDIVFYLNNSLSYIDSKHDWSFLKTEKTITLSSEGKVFTLPTDLYVVYEITGVSSDDSEKILYESGRSGVDDSSYKLLYNTVKTKEDFKSLKIFATWGMAYVNNTTEDLDNIIPLPRLLVFALYNLLLAQAMPSYLDDGYKLSGFHYQTADQAISGAIAKYSTQSGTRDLRPTH